MATKFLFPRLVLAGILTTGFLVVWGVVGLWAMQFGAVVTGTGESDRMLIFLHDGTPRLAHFDFRDGQTQYWDLEGNPVPPPQNEMAGVSAPGFRAVPAIDSLQLTVLPEQARPGESGWDRRIRSFSDGGSPAVYWYFLSDGQLGGTGYFVGYNNKSCACVGYLGTAGFRSGPLPSEELIPFDGAVGRPEASVLCLQGDFTTGRHPEGRGAWGLRAPHGSVSPSDVYVVGRGGRIYQADLQQRTVHVALEEPQLRSAGLITGVRDQLQGTPTWLAARTDEAVLVLDDRGRLRKRYPIPEPLRDQDIQFGETTVGEALMYWKSPRDVLAAEGEHRIYWVAADGRFRETSVTLPTSDHIGALRVLAAAVTPSPLVLGGTLTAFGPGTLFEQGRHWATYGTALGRTLAAFSPALVIAQLLAAGLAVLCYRRQVRYQASRSERVIWPLFVLAFGLPGWVAYRFGRSWPVLESCQACGVGVPLDRGACAHCEAEFPVPALQGTEVFA